VSLQTRVFSKGFIGITLFTLSITLICIVLGFWQLQRLEWKENLLSSLKVSDATAFEPIEKVITSYENTSSYNLKKVHLKGVFHHELEIKLIPRTLKGKSGAHLLTPFVLSSGKLIIINRGWIPENLDHKIPVRRLSGEVEIFGFVRQPSPKSKITPKNDPANGLWFSANLKEISQFLRHTDKTLPKEILPFYVMQKPDKTYEGYPVPIDLFSTLPNNHFQYALTWFFLAFGLILGYIGYVRVYGCRR